jgi:hypothetical protein
LAQPEKIWSIFMLVVVVLAGKRPRTLGLILSSN